MRKLLRFTIGFSIPCILGTILVPKYISVVYLCFFAAVSGILCCCSFALNAKRIMYYFTGMLLGAAWLFCYFRYYLIPVQETVGTSEITIADYGETGKYSTYYGGILQFRGKYYRVSVSYSGNEQLQPGDRLTGSFSLKNTAPGGESESVYCQGNGVFLTVSATAKKSTILHRDNCPFWAFPSEIAKWIRQLLKTLLPEDVVGFAQALILGDTSLLSYIDDTSLKLSGIRHVAAVSGLHVSVLFGCIVLLFGTQKWKSILVSIPTLFLIAAVAGFTPSVTRACLMCALIALGRFSLEDYDALTGLAASCLLMLIINPFVWKSVSFQLSVASVSGILVFSAEPV